MVTTKGFTSTCPVGCGRSVRPGHLMCGACWRLVPKFVQAEVWRTWRRYQKDSSDENYDAYVHARAEAIGAVS